VTGVALGERPGTRDTTCGASALASPASSARLSRGSSTASAGLPNTRRTSVPQSGHFTGAADSAIDLVSSNPPQVLQK
jgi:hypothetical protein